MLIQWMQLLKFSPSVPPFNYRNKKYNSQSHHKKRTRSDFDAQVCIIIRLPATVPHMVSLDSKLYFAGITPTLKICVGSFKGIN